MNPIERNAMNTLSSLVEEGRRSVDGEGVRALTGLEPEEINDAVEFLHDLGAVDVLRFIGTAPYTFGTVEVNSRGRYLYYEAQEQASSAEREGEGLLPLRPVNPVGSPYGFTDDDWEFVGLRRADAATLHVVFGLQFQSEFYGTEELITNIEQHFADATEMYNESRPSNEVALQFERLTAGYGEHLFNTIARSIIGSDIAVFEVSDHNPNVMIEVGVALTWGVRVVPLRQERSSEPPSDISGQTWIGYRDSGASILDDQFRRKLVLMVDRAIAKKGGAILSVCYA